MKYVSYVLGLIVLLYLPATLIIVSLAAAGGEGSIGAKMLAMIIGFPSTFLIGDDAVTFGSVLVSLVVGAGQWILLLLLSLKLTRQ
ncbi:MAG: hypothetical protein KDA85_09520 [Planctomycetaceae bacterium]|nr:hypothetical protein [Planctomycetaceae bacterium]